MELTRVNNNIYEHLDNIIEVFILCPNNAYLDLQGGIKT